MRIPITIGSREEPLIREPEPLGLHTRLRDEYGYPKTRAGRRSTETPASNRSNLALDQRGRDEDETDTRGAANSKEARQEGPLHPRQEQHARTEETDDNWKDRYVRLRADFENYKRHAEAKRDQLVGIGREEVLEDVFPIVEHMERAIQAAKDSGDRTGILEGIEMVYSEMLRVLEKHGVERIRTVGEPFDPEVHEAVAVTAHPDYPENTVAEEVRAGFAKNGKLLRAASVVVVK